MSTPEAVPPTCKHASFTAHVDVTRIVESNRLYADVKVQCAGCGLPMRFIGLPAGVDVNGAAVSADACEARLAMAPKGEVIPPLDPRAVHGFSVRIADRPRKDYYFGCWNNSVGHYLYDTAGRLTRGAGVGITDSVLDTTFAPKGHDSQAEGEARLVHFGSVTILAFWDRSVDTRGNSNSAFVLEGVLDFAAACKQAQESFPKIWSRFKFPIRPWVK